MNCTVKVWKSHNHDCTFNYTEFLAVFLKNKLMYENVTFLLLCMECAAWKCSLAGHRRLVLYGFGNCLSWGSWERSWWIFNQIAHPTIKTSLLESAPSHLFWILCKTSHRSSSGSDNDMARLWGNKRFALNLSLIITYMWITDSDNSAQYWGLLQFQYIFSNLELFSKKSYGLCNYMWCVKIFYHRCSLHSVLSVCLISCSMWWCWPENEDYFSS